MCVRILLYVSSDIIYAICICPHTIPPRSWDIYVSSYYYICVLILLYMCPLILHMCPHNTKYVSSYYYMCPHTTTCVLIPCLLALGIYMCYVSAYHPSSLLGYICVLILLLYMCPHTTICVSSYYCVSVLYCYMCPHTTT